MIAVFDNFDSEMADRIKVDTDSGLVDVTFKKSGSTYRFELDNASVNDIVSVATSRSKGRHLHSLLDIKNGTRIDNLAKNTNKVIAVTF
jgi:hypothetical protein